MEKKKLNLMPLNIQLFAEGEGEGNGVKEDTPKTYTQEEYDKIIAERDKLKNANDNLSKENAEHKRKAKEKLSEEEKKNQEEKEKDEALQKARQELLSIKMSKEFMIAGFDENTTNEIIESFNKGDSVSFAKTLSDKIKLLVDNARKEEKENFQKSAKIPPTGSGKQSSGIDPIVERYINNKNSNTNSARELYLNRNKK